MNVQVPGGPRRGRLATEALTAGLAFAALLGWASTALVGSFRGQDLPDRYWQPIPVRTDTSGFIAFVAAAVWGPARRRAGLTRNQVLAAAAYNRGP